MRDFGRADVRERPVGSELMVSIRPARGTSVLMLLLERLLMLKMDELLLGNEVEVLSISSSEVGVEVCGQVGNEAVGAYGQIEWVHGGCDRGIREGGRLNDSCPLGGTKSLAVRLVAFGVVTCRWREVSQVRKLAGTDRVVYRVTRLMMLVMIGESASKSCPPSLVGREGTKLIAHQTGCSDRTRSCALIPGATTRPSRTNTDSTLTNDLTVPHLVLGSTDRLGTLELKELVGRCRGKGAHFRSFGNTRNARARREKMHRVVLSRSGSSTNLTTN